MSKLFSINFNLRELCRELRKKNIQFSTNGKIVSILPISLHITREYIGIYQDNGNHKVMFKKDKKSCDLILDIINIYYPVIKAETVNNGTSIFGLQVIITKNDICVMQNGRIL